MRVLGIETSCDETGVAVYDSEAGLKSHALHSQIALHQLRGVLPQLASPTTSAIWSRCRARRRGGRLTLADRLHCLTEGPGLAAPIGRRDVANSLANA